MILGLLPIATFQTGRAKTEPLSTRNEQSFRVIRGQKGTGNHLDEESPGDLRHFNKIAYPSKPSDSSPILRPFRRNRLYQTFASAMI
jgi:hypothetical protein